MLPSWCAQLDETPRFRLTFTTLNRLSGGAGGYPQKQDAACSRWLSWKDAQTVAPPGTGRVAVNQLPVKAQPPKSLLDHTDGCNHASLGETFVMFCRYYNRSPPSFVGQPSAPCVTFRETLQLWHAWSWHVSLPALSFFKSASSGST